MKKDDEKLRLLADYIKHNTTLPIDVEEFLLECASRAESWGGYLPYKPYWADTNENENKPKSTKDTIPAGLKRIFDNMDEEYK
jgi:hypothetical protein